MPHSCPICGTPAMNGNSGVCWNPECQAAWAAQVRQRQEERERAEEARADMRKDERE